MQEQDKISLDEIKSRSLPIAAVFFEKKEKLASLKQGIVPVGTGNKAF